MGRRLPARNRRLSGRILQLKHNLVINPMQHNGFHPAAGNVDHQFVGGDNHRNVKVPEANPKLETAKNNCNRKLLRLLW
jgi:hypothetical protein